MIREQLYLSGIFVLVPILAGWCKWRYWVWLEER
jgi:hypothetical protein